MVVRPRIVMYLRRMALRRVELEGEPRERETYVAKAASLRLKIGEAVGLMEKVRVVGVEGVKEVGCGVATRSRRLVSSQRERVSGLREQKWRVRWG